VGFLDLPDRPDEPGHPERASMSGADRPTLKPRESHDPDERGRVYDAMYAHTSAGAAQESSDAAGESQQDQQADAAGQRDYRGEVPRFMEMWAGHEIRWPAGQPGTADAAGSHHRDGEFRLRSERQAETAEALARVREAEPGLSADAQAIEQENKARYGGWLEGFEDRLKGEDRLLEKVDEGLTTTSPDATPKQVLQLIPDAIRFTYCFQAESFTRGYHDIKERFEGRSHEMYYSKNYWTDPEYKGINTRWVTPAGQRFEVQFHTPDSFHAKHQVTHPAYKRIRDPTTSRAELRELHAFQREVSSWIQVPNGAADIPDTKKEGF
jgi:hypothetical protein